jgi:ribonuclease T1
MMPRLFLILALLLLVGAGAAAADDPALAAFARQEHLRDVTGFIATVRALDESGELPADRYVTKQQAERKGWHGGDLCRFAPGRAIGGDVFRNAQGLLPNRHGRQWHEADLDYACGSRGAKRLVFSTDGLKYVTVDHYQSFQPVPE